MEATIHVVVDASQPRFHGLLEWASAHGHLLADALLTGQHLLEAGVESLVRSEVEKRCGRDLQADVQLRARRLAAAAEAEAASLEKQVRRLQDQLEEARSAAEARVAEALQGIRQSHGLEVGYLRESLDRAERRLLEARGEADAEVSRRSADAARAAGEQVAVLREALAAAASTELSSLREQLSAAREELRCKASELQQFKGSNHGKAVIGEGLIQSLLERQYPQMVVRMTGGSARSGDVHLVDPETNNIVMFESKLKEKITQGDVSKFYRDIDDMGNCAAAEGGRCVGAVFVSLRSCSIPGKGAACLELRGGVPVMFVGFESEKVAQEALLPQLQMLVDMSAALAAEPPRASEGELQSVLQDVSAVMAGLQRNLQRLSRLRTEHVAAVQRILVEMERESTEVGATLSALLLRHGVAAAPTEASTALSCPSCGKVCGSRSALTKHTRQCGGRD